MKSAAEKNLGCIKYVPDHFKIEKMCIKAIKKDVETLEHVPDHFKTQEVCIKAVEKEAESIEHDITDIFTIDVNKVAVSDKVLCNNVKDCHYIVGYQVDEALIPRFIKMIKDIFSYGVSKYDKNSFYTMSFNVSEEICVGGSV